MKNISLIIFDLDGTLVNSQHDIRDGINFSLKKLGRSILSYPEVQSMVGGGVNLLVDKAFKEADEEEIALGLRFFKEYYRQNLTAKTIPYQGVLETLQHFDKIKKAVYSNKSHPLTIKVIQQLNMTDYFEIVQGADQTKYASKPSPEGIIHILNTLKISPDKAMMVGDSTHDIHAAQRAGIRSCAVTYGYRSLKVLEEAKPDFVIHKMEELKKLLE